MKRPYREGDRFAVPLGDGRLAAGVVTGGTRKVLQGTFFAPESGEALWSGRFSDRALVQLRWPVTGREPGYERHAWPQPESDAIAEPGFVERLLAAKANGEAFERARLFVRDLRPPVEASAFEGLPQHLRLQWRSPLNERELELVERCIAARPGASARPYGAAAAQAALLARWSGPARLHLDSACALDALAPFERVEALELDGIPADPQRLAAIFPALRCLDVRARGARFDAAWLRGSTELRALAIGGASLERAEALCELPALRALDVRDCRVGDVAMLLRLPVQALRLARVPGVASIAALAGNAAVRVLALENLTHLDDLSPIAALPNLESLDLRGLWQFAVEDAAFAPEMPHLRRLRVDIGGRRKNVELYKRRPLAEPVPLPEAFGVRSLRTDPA